MRKQRKAIGLLLAAALAMTVCSCGKQGGDAAGDGSPEPGDWLEDQGELDGVPAEKRYVWSMEELDLGGFGAEGARVAVRQTVQSGGRLYLFATENNPEGTAAGGMQLLSMKEDGSDIKQVQLAAGAEADSADAKVSYDCCQVGKDEKIYAIKRVEVRDEDGLLTRDDTYVCCWDQAGETLWETLITDLQVGLERTYIDAVVCLADGNVALLTKGHDIGKFIVDAQGSLSTLQMMGDYSEAFQNPVSMMPREDGTMLILYYANGGADLGMVEFNVEKDTMGEKELLPESVTWNRIDRVTTDGENSLIYSNREGVFRYRAGDQSVTQIMDYYNSDLPIFGMSAVFPLKSGKMIAFFQDDVQGRFRGGVFSGKAPEDIPDKELLVLAGINIGNDVYRSAVAFNQSSATHRIKIDDYSVYNSGENNRAGYEKLNNDILSEEYVPDILVLTGSGISTEEYAARGLLADVDALIAGDDRFSSADFLGNVFDACRINGKLYEVVPYFQVETYAGKTSLIGGRAAWQLADAEEVLADMPEGSVLIAGLSETQFLSRILFFDYEDFVDKNAGSCNFKSPEFISLLEYGKSHADGADAEEALLAGVVIGNLGDADAALCEIFDEEVTFVGFPTPGSQGSVVRTPLTFAVMSGAKHPEAAWEFVGAYLTEDYQSGLKSVLPVNKSCFNAQQDQLSGTYVSGLAQLCGSVKKRAGCPGAVILIAQEETEQFFYGRRSASDAASIIQSRVQGYLDEKK